MQPKVQLSIPQPCHEDWHKMTPSQQGRFCNACAKQVVDFTTMSDTEVLHYFLDKQGEKVCGRMYPDQLNRPVTKAIYPQKKKWWQWNYAVMFLLFFSKSITAKAQGSVKVIKTEQPPAGKEVEVRATMGMVAKASPLAKSITGNITDEDGNPVPFASVIIKGTKQGASADANGRYTIKAKTTDILQVSAVGYNLIEVNLKALSSYDIILAPQKNTLEGDVVVTLGGISSDYDYYPPSSPKHIAVIEVLDNATHKPVKATLQFNKTGYKKDTAITDTKGIYKLKRITESDKFTVTVKADGYLPTELDIKGWAFNERKESKYVFLEKPAAEADYKKLDNVTVSSYENGPCRRGVTMGASIMSITVTRTVADTMNQFKTKVTGSLKIAPNPVIRGSVIAVAYKTSETGNYILQVTSAAGQVVHRQQLVALQKNNTTQFIASTAWSAGLYYVSIINANNKLLSTNSFIVH